MINANDYFYAQFSVAITEDLNNELVKHLDKGPKQEDLTFALWKPSCGDTRFTAIIQKLVLPLEGDRILQGNASFTAEYVLRVLKEAGKEYGIAFIHSHLGPGWQGMSSDDIIAERDRLASAVAGVTRLPLLGLTLGTDGSWSARLWIRQSPKEYICQWASTVRVVGKFIKITYHPVLMPTPASTKSQVATVSVWGNKKQSDLVRTHVGIVGLGSVGSIVAESLSRLGITNITLIDYDVIEQRNLDRTLGAVEMDAHNRTPKVKVSERLINYTHTADKVSVDAFEGNLVSVQGMKKALDCDVIFSCVDRPWPRHLLNSMAYAHLIPIIDGGILAKVDNGRLLHADWRIHTISPGRPCMVCLGALNREHISLDMEGLLDDPAYIEGLSPEFKVAIARQNVFPFSLSVAAHEVLQFIGLVTGEQRIGGKSAQMYHCYPGVMEQVKESNCSTECLYSQLTASACDLSGNLK